MKSPKGTGKHNIQHCLQDALKQSSYIIIDARASKQHMEKITHELQHQITLTRKIDRFLANNKPDLILLDYEMPVTSGPKVLEVLSQKPNGYLLKSLKQQELMSSLDEFYEKQKVNKIVKIAQTFS